LRPLVLSFSPIHVAQQSYAFVSDHLIGCPYSTTHLTKLLLFFSVSLQPISTHPFTLLFSPSLAPTIAFIALLPTSSTPRIFISMIPAPSTSFPRVSAPQPTQPYAYQANVSNRP
jgi:hypothetical protein